MELQDLDYTVELAGGQAAKLKRWSLPARNTAIGMFESLWACQRAENYHGAAVYRSEIVKLTLGVDDIGLESVVGSHPVDGIKNLNALFEAIYRREGPDMFEATGRFWIDPDLSLDEQKALFDAEMKRREAAKAEGEQGVNPPKRKTGAAIEIATSSQKQQAG